MWKNKWDFVFSVNDDGCANCSLPCSAEGENNMKVNTSTYCVNSIRSINSPRCLTRMRLPRCSFTALLPPEGDLCPLFSNLALGLFRAQFLGRDEGGKEQMERVRGKFPQSRVTTESFLMNDFHLEVKSLGRTILGRRFLHHLLYHHVNLFYNFVHFSLSRYVLFH